jgi:hypothetical protein
MKDESSSTAAEERNVIKIQDEKQQNRHLSVDIYCIVKFIR